MTGINGLGRALRTLVNRDAAVALAAGMLTFYCMLATLTVLVALLTVVGRQRSRGA